MVTATISNFFWGAANHAASLMAGIASGAAGQPPQTVDKMASDFSPARRDFLRAVASIGKAGIVAGVMGGITAAGRKAEAIKLGELQGTDRNAQISTQPPHAEAGHPQAEGEKTVAETNGASTHQLLFALTFSLLPYPPVALYLFFNTPARKWQRELTHAEMAANLAREACAGHAALKAQLLYNRSRDLADRVCPDGIEVHERMQNDLRMGWAIPADRELYAESKASYDRLLQFLTSLHECWSRYLTALPSSRQATAEHLAIGRFFEKCQRFDISAIHFARAASRAKGHAAAGIDMQLLKMFCDMAVHRAPTAELHRWLASGEAHDFLRRMLDRGAAAYQGHPLYGTLRGLLTDFLLQMKSLDVKTIEEWRRLLEDKFVPADPEFLTVSATARELCYTHGGNGNLAARLAYLEHAVADLRRYEELIPGKKRRQTRARIAGILTIMAQAAKSASADAAVISLAFERAGREWECAGDWSKALANYAKAADSAEESGDFKRASTLRVRAMAEGPEGHSHIIDSKGGDTITGIFIREATRRTKRPPLSPSVGTGKLEGDGHANVMKQRPLVLSRTGVAKAAKGPMERLYSELPVYAGADMFAPPAEKFPHVLRLVLTQGCEYGECTYCTGYRGVAASVLSPDEFRAHIVGAFAFLTGIADVRDLGLRRMFIGSGDALSVPTEQLAGALKLATAAFREATGAHPRRVAAYGRTSSILKKTPEELRRIRHAGLDMVYWGIESGANEVLRYVRKGQTREQMERAAEMLRDAFLQASVMVMPGLGGARLYGSHVAETAALLSAINPRYITLMGVNAAPDTPYAARMRQEMAEGTNRPLTDAETALQVAEMTERMAISVHTMMGSYPAEIDCVGQNVITFGNTPMHDLFRINLAATIRLRSRMIGCVPEEIIPAAVRALSDFVADEEESIFLRIYAAKILACMGYHARDAIPAIEAFVEKYPVDRLADVSGGIERIRRAAKPDLSEILKPPPSFVRMGEGVWLAGFLDELVRALCEK